MADINALTKAANDAYEAYAQAAAKLDEALADADGGGEAETVAEAPAEAAPEAPTA